MIHKNRLIRLYQIVRNLWYDLKESQDLAHADFVGKWVFDHLDDPSFDDMMRIQKSVRDEKEKIKNHYLNLKNK